MSKYSRNSKQAFRTGLVIAAMLSAVPVDARDRTSLDDFVNGFPMELEKATREAGYNELFKGGDVSAYFNVRVAEFMATSVLPSRQPVMQFGSRPLPEIGSVQVETANDGTLTLDEFLAKPDLYAQAYLVVHKGDIVYERYPRIRPEDHHLWMSCAKPTASLVIDILISEGKIDEDAPITTYLTDFKGTDWDNVPVRAVLDMETGMDLEDTPESRFDPANVARRVYEAEFGYPNDNTGEVELLADVLRSTEAKGEPGQAFEYASGVTQVLVLLAEAVESERWPQIFDRLVWSKVGAESALQLHLTPDGIAAAHGLVSSNLRDFARFGMLYTPSWNKVAAEQVVSDEILARIRDGVSPPEVFTASASSGPRLAGVVGASDDVGNSRQWDVVWPDGDMWKSGLMTQGLYVSPSRDLVIVYFSVNNDDSSLARFVRPIATSGLFDE